MINKSDSHHAGSARHKIVIMGSRKAGKTTLCASLHQSLITSAHGFSPEMTTRFPDAAGLARLESLFAEKFAADPASFRSDKGPAIRRFRIGMDFSSTKWRLFRQEKDQLNGYFDIEIADLRDDFDLYANYQGQFNNEASPSSEPGTLSIQKTISEFVTCLKEANTLILCHPAGEKLAPSEASGFIRLMSDIAIGRFGHFETIILALSKYERLFLKDGVHALQKAIQPDEIIKAITTTFNQDINLEYGLNILNSHSSETPHLYALPVSSFGFMKNNGAANFDPERNSPISALAPQAITPKATKETSDHKLSAALTGPKIKSEVKYRLAGVTIPLREETPALAASDEPPHPGPHWLPFLAGDPILTAISGIPSQFTLPLSEFLASLERQRTDASTRLSA